MSVIYQAFGAFHLRIYSSVNISTGEPLSGPRKQQSILLHRQDEHFKAKSSPGVRALANLKEGEIKDWERAAISGEVRPDGNMLVKDFFENVFMPYIRDEKEASTAKSYRGYWNAYLAPHFNHTKTLKGYESWEGTNLLETLCKTLSDNSVNHARALASGIFSYATAKGYIKYNPFRDVKKTSTGQDVEDGYAYNEREIEDILAALEHVSGREDRSAELAGMLVTLCFFGGLRPSEAAGLKWEGVNFNDARIKIQSAFVQGNLKGTKTGKIRTIVMLPQLLHRLKLWALREGYPTTGFVFQNRDGNPVNVNDLSSRVIAKTLKESEIEWEGFYACRRGFGTIMVLAGCTLDEVADAMGNSPDVVFRHYFKDKDSKLAAKGFARLASAMAGEHVQGQKTLTAGVSR